MKIKNGYDGYAYTFEKLTSFALDSNCEHGLGQLEILEENNKRLIASFSKLLEVLSEKQKLKACDIERILQYYRVEGLTFIKDKL